MRKGPTGTRPSNCLRLLPRPTGRSARGKNRRRHRQTTVLNLPGIKLLSIRNAHTIRSLPSTNSIETMDLDPGFYIPSIAKDTLNKAFWPGLCLTERRGVRTAVQDLLASTHPLEFRP